LKHYKRQEKRFHLLHCANLEDSSGTYTSIQLTEHLLQIKATIKNGHHFTFITDNDMVTISAEPI